MPENKNKTAGQELTREQVFAKLFREEKSKLSPSLPNWLTGQQVAYAKGRAMKAFLALGY